MSASNEHRVNESRSQWPAVLCRFACATLLVVGPHASAQSQASDSVTRQKPDAPRDSASRPDSAVHQDSVVYRVASDSRFEVTTSKAGLFGFAGHTHTVRARAFIGSVVYYPSDPAASHLEMIIPTDSLEVLTPPDTAEIRQVTETMRTQVLRVTEYPEIRFVAANGSPTKNGMKLQGELTLVGRTRPVPVDAALQIGPDTIRANGTFSVKQTDFGIKPYSGGPAGTVKVGDRLRFEFDAIAVRTDTSANVSAKKPDPPQ